MLGSFPAIPISISKINDWFRQSCTVESANWKNLTCWSSFGVVYSSQEPEFPALIQPVSSAILQPFSETAGLTTLNKTKKVQHSKNNKEICIKI